MLFTKQKWCAGGGPLSKINSKDVLTMAYLKGKKIPLEELTEFTKESRFFVLKNKNYLRKMENNLEQFGFEQRVMPTSNNSCVRASYKHTCINLLLFLNYNQCVDLVHTKEQYKTKKIFHATAYLRRRPH